MVLIKNTRFVRYNRGVQGSKPRLQEASGAVKAIPKSQIKPRFEPPSLSFKGRDDLCM